MNREINSQVVQRTKRT